MLAMMMTLRNNSGTDPSSSNPPAVVYRDVAVAGGAPLLLLLHTLYFSIRFYPSLLHWWPTGALFSDATSSLELIISMVTLIFGKLCHNVFSRNA